MMGVFRLARAAQEKAAFRGLQSRISARFRRPDLDAVKMATVGTFWRLFKTSRYRWKPQRRRRNIEVFKMRWRDFGIG